MSNTRPEESLLNTLPADLRIELRSKAYTRRYQKNKQIICQDEPSSDFFIINYGAARVVIYSPSGVKLSFVDIQAGEYFGELATIDGMPRSATVIALEETSLTRLSAEKFNHYIATYPGFAQCIMRNLCGLVRRLNTRIYEFATLNVQQRIHSEYLRIADRLEVIDNQAVQNIPPTHVEMATLISTRREAVSREYIKLRKAGIIEKRAKKLYFNDVSALRDLVQQANNN